MLSRSLTIWTVLTSLVYFSKEGLLMLRIEVKTLIFHDSKGILIEPCIDKDFWLLLSPEVGYGRFSLINQTTFGLVEVRHLDEIEQNQVFLVSNVLWHRKAALSAWKDTCPFCFHSKKMT